MYVAFPFYDIAVVNFFCEIKGNCYVYYTFTHAKLKVTKAFMRELMVVYIHFLVIFGLNAVCSYVEGI